MGKRPHTAASKKRIMKVKRDRRILAKYGPKAVAILAQRGQAKA